MFIQNFLCLMIGEKEHKFLLHDLSLILELVSNVTIPFVFNFIIDDLFNNILKSHDSNNFFRWISVFILYNLSDYTDVSQAFLEKAQKRLQLVLAFNGNNVSHNDTR